MFGWRITKYNPKYRDNQGFYTKDEWTDYSDIGRKFEGKEFILNEYLKVEEAYIQAVLLFMKDLNIDSLRISHLINNGRACKKVLTNDKIELINNTYVNKECITYIIQLILRNEIGCKLKAKEMYVELGWDFYMYIGSLRRPSSSTIEKIEQIGLFIEQCIPTSHNIDILR